MRVQGIGFPASGSLCARARLIPNPSMMGFQKLGTPFFLFGGPYDESLNILGFIMGPLNTPINRLTELSFQPLFSGRLGLVFRV